MKIIPQVTPEMVINLYWVICYNNKARKADIVLFKHKIVCGTRSEDIKAIQNCNRKLLLQLFGEFQKCLDENNS